MDLEERTRLAVQRLPAPGIASAILGRWVLPMLFGLLGCAVYALLWLLREGHTLGLKELLAGIAFTLAVLVLMLKQRSASRRVTRGAELLFRGDLEGASRAFFEVIDDSLGAPMLRAQAGAMLASTAVVGGHADRAMVLLRAVTVSGATMLGQRTRIQVITATALLALGRPADARTLLATCRETSALGARLLVEALAGTVVDATLAAARLAQRRELRIKRGWMRDLQIAFAWLLVAYVWDRAARALPPSERADAEKQRAEALAKAKGVPPHFHAYLAASFPDFDRFARAAA